MNDNKGPAAELIFTESNFPLIKQLCDGMPGGFFIYMEEGDGEITYINKAMLRIFGCGTEGEFRELTGNTFKGLVHPNDYERVQKSIYEQLDNSPYSLDYVEYRITRRDGSVRWIEDYGRLIRSDKGNFFYVFIEDATERMRHRMDELEKMNTKLRDIHVRDEQYHKAILNDAITFFEVNVTNDSFISTNVPRANIGTVNLFDMMKIPEFTCFSEFVEYCTGSMGSKEAGDYRRFFDIGRIKECYRQGDLKQVFEAPFVDSSGKDRLFQYTLLLGKNNFSDDIIALTVIKDITEFNERQNRFKTALSEAKAVNIAEQMYLTNISNNIQSPLNSIRSFTDMLEYNLSNPSILKYCIEKIRTASGELFDIVNQSRMIPHMKSEMTILGVSGCDLNDLFVNLKRRIAAKASKSKIYFSVDSSEVTDFSVYLNTIQLEEALWQLTDNAVKHSKAGGTVCLTVKESAEAPKGFGTYSFEVSDSGAGMSGEIVEMLNRPYDMDSSGLMHMDGLGLAVVRNIVYMMKGSVRAESIAGEGTRVTITLTLPHRNSFGISEEESGITIAPASEGRHILIVDDDRITLEIEQALLESCGYIVDTAANGRQALRKFQCAEPIRYDFILLDIQMPLMNGYETASAIRALDDPAFAGIPIIAISSEAYNAEREKAFEYGINEHLSKPLDIAAVQSCIARITGK